MNKHNDKVQCFTPMSCTNGIQYPNTVRTVHCANLDKKEKSFN